MSEVMDLRAGTLYQKIFLTMEFDARGAFPTSDFYKKHDICKK